MYRLSVRIAAIVNDLVCIRYPNLPRGFRGARGVKQVRPPYPAHSFALIRDIVSRC